MRTLAELQELVNDYEIVASGPWDDASRARLAVLEQIGSRTHQSFAVRITELIIDAGVHRGEALR